MIGFAKTSVLLLFLSSMAIGDDRAVMQSVQATQDVTLDLDPTSPFWRASSPVYLEKDTLGKVAPRYRTEVRTRWTKNNLYFLFVCPYQQLLPEAFAGSSAGNEPVVELGRRRSVYRFRLQRYSTLQGIRSVAAGGVDRPGYQLTQPAPRRRMDVEFRI